MAQTLKSRLRRLDANQQQRIATLDTTLAACRKAVVILEKNVVEQRDGLSQIKLAIKRFEAERVALLR